MSQKKNNNNEESKGSRDNREQNNGTPAPGNENATETSNTQCSICRAQITNQAFAEPCHHSFCFECIRQWTLNRNTCPVCRQLCTQITHNYRSPLQFDRLTVQPSQPIPLERTLVCVNLIGDCQVFTQLFVPGYFISTRNTGVAIFRRGQSMLLNQNSVYHFMNTFGDEAIVVGEQIEQLHPFLNSFERLRVRQLFLHALANAGVPQIGFP
ncbi:E3 ubiquitin-protein ligase Topors-like isoform X1 [Leptotrombidium deliense]|uniref:RING-type E3 ubiquitin transferase n=1 Tax=Leptotrombidium deliense TaxID=299467 RepID=A0A443SKG0_9ACAR|nr:E3 ubiquitin-protein ligase Topors-like isoform X1 [Leptotrombidium deliense]